MPGRRYEGLSLAASKPEPERIDGFISVERIESLATPGKLLSLSFLRDKRGAAWRNRPGHHPTRAKGRGGVFSDYRPRIGTFVRDYSLTDRADAPDDSRDVHHA